MAAFCEGSGRSTSVTMSCREVGCNGAAREAVVFGPASLVQESELTEVEDSLALQLNLHVAAHFAFAGDLGTSRAANAKARGPAQVRSLRNFGYTTPGSLVISAPPTTASQKHDRAVQHTLVDANMPCLLRAAALQNKSTQVA